MLVSSFTHLNLSCKSAFLKVFKMWFIFEACLALLFLNPKSTSTTLVLPRVSSSLFKPDSSLPLYISLPRNGPADIPIKYCLILDHSSERSQLIEVHSQNLPSDPYIYLVPYRGDPGISIKFYHYGPKRLPKICVIEALREALTERREHEDETFEPLGTEEMQFESWGVVLLLHPKEGMIHQL